jgi:glycerol-3-phosphate dehydrogenase (NAD(P)+)
MFISRGLVDIVKMGVAMGAQQASFLTIAGVGDLIATCNSSLSRNYTLGYQLAQGKSLEVIRNEGQLMAEGVKTVTTIRSLAKTYAIHVPVVEMVYKVLFESLSAEESMRQLMQS